MSSTPRETLESVLRPLLADPASSGIFLDVDGTLAPIVERADQAHVPERTSRLLGALVRRYGCVACISGRAAAEARRLVGVGGIAYAGAHGAELLEPGHQKATILPEFESWTERVRQFVADRDERDMRLLRIRIEDKGAISALHWRGAPDEEVARARLEEIAREAEQSGLTIHWGRKVLEIRPPVPVDKGKALRGLVGRFGVTNALFAGDDATDLDAFDALDELAAGGELEAAVRVGIESDEGPAAIVERADLVVHGIPGFVAVLEALSAT